MLEISPRIILSLDNILELRKTVDEEYRGVEHVFDQQKEKLAALPGFEVVEEQADSLLRVDLNKVLHSAEEINADHTQAEQLIRDLDYFTYFSYDDLRDGVFSLQFWSEIGANGGVYPQFQRWLNSDVLSEETVRSCLEAMAIPFGSQATQKVEDEFNYRSDGVSSGSLTDHLTFGVVVEPQQFRVTVLDYDADEPERTGNVIWNRLLIHTIGSCACWGVDGMDMDDVFVTPEKTKLYEMKSHNVEYAKQSLSLVLGVARLAFVAANYEGQEDILANAQWRPPRR